MKDFLAGLLVILIIVVYFVATSDKPPEAKDRFTRTLCANITCFYEIKDSK